MGDMWNSNSVASWLLALSGLPVNRIRAPVGDRASGWDVGIVAARRQAGGRQWLRPVDIRDADSGVPRAS
jgi:hypothetical protein